MHIINPFVLEIMTPSTLTNDISVYATESTDKPDNYNNITPLYLKTIFEKYFVYYYQLSYSIYLLK